MRMCMNHWNRLREELEDVGLLIANVLMMKKFRERLGKDVYKAQKEVGDGCLICWLKDDRLFDAIVKETKEMLKEKVE